MGIGEGGLRMVQDGSGKHVEGIVMNGGGREVILLSSEGDGICGIAWLVLGRAHL